ncbi:MAG: magnesium/cobalt transporter CorA [Spirochaetaceae bacterium]|jgi:magnesium transporter|nr:magnesium/cobalt transporter CorA [Spirochaetaceae bacterium]
MKYIKNIGLPPGSLFKAMEHAQEAELEIFSYDKESYESKKINFDELDSDKIVKNKVLWLNIIGTDSKILEKLGNTFSLKFLSLEDIQNTDHRPKIDEFENYIHTIVKMLSWDDQFKMVQSEQINILWGKNFVISIQERKGDVFNSIRDRIRKDQGRVRNKGADYLAYALIDALVDNYFLVCENLQEEYEILEDSLNNKKPKEFLKKIHRLKKEIILLRKSIWPLREILITIHKGEYNLVSKDSYNYFKDIYDHSLFIIDMIELLRELLTGLQESLISTVSFDMNNIMKVLTIISTIFIPLTFIAGIYGMNFINMPELAYKWSYFIVLGGMFFIFIMMMLFFKRKKWL